MSVELNLSSLLNWLDTVKNIELETADVTEFKIGELRGAIEPITEKLLETCALPELQSVRRTLIDLLEVSLMFLRRIEIYKSDTDYLRDSHFTIEELRITLSILVVRNKIRAAEGSKINIRNNAQEEEVLGIVRAIADRIGLEEIGAVEYAKSQFQKSREKQKSWGEANTAEEYSFCTGNEDVEPKGVASGTKQPELVV